MNTIRGIIENRVNTTGAVEAVIETQGNDQIVVQVPERRTRSRSRLWSGNPAG